MLRRSAPRNDVPKRPFDPASLVIRPVDRKTWPDLERLFEAPGGPKHCWCMVWRAMPVGDRKLRQDRKDALHTQVRRGEPVGLLAYLDQEPVAWCSVAPRPTYRRMGPPLPGIPDDRVWSIVCFFIKRPLRGTGIMVWLISAATDHARAAGALVVEAYPVAADAPSYRFMGFVPVFEKAGFTEIGPIGTRRHLMQKRVG